jgi:hypothetical protein
MMRLEVDCRMMFTEGDSSWFYIVGNLASNHLIALSKQRTSPQFTLSREKTSSPPLKIKVNHSYFEHER